MARKNSERWKLLAAHLEKELVKALRKKLIDDDMTYTDWLRNKIRGYLYERPERRARKEQRK